MLKTVVRLVLALFLFLAWVPLARAWSWPVQGPVLQPFVYDEAHPYAAGQHRGIDIGADAAGETVVAPAAGTVDFAGTVPASGKSVTIQTPDGYSITLTHLGSILASEGSVVAEGEAVGTVGPSGTPEEAGPYLHLGIRITADPNGYIDPLGLLPSVTAEAPPPDSGSGSGSSAAQPSASGGSSGAPAPATAAAPAQLSAQSAAVSAAPATVRGSSSSIRRSRGSQARRTRVLRPDAQPSLLGQRPAADPADAARRVQPRAARLARRPRNGKPSRSARRPGVEVAVPVKPTSLGAGHESGRGARGAQSPRTEAPSVLLALLCNGAAALVALGAALAAACQRRRRKGRSPLPGAEIFQLSRPAFEGRERRAA